MLPYETLERLQFTAVNAAGLEVHEIPGDPRVVLISQGGRHEKYELPAPLRDHYVRTLGDIVKSVGEWGGSGIIWVGQKQIVLVTQDEGDRRDRITLPLTYSDKYLAIANLGSGKRFSQKDLIRFLRVTLADALLDPTIVTGLRKLRFSSNTSGHAEHSQGRDSLGRTVDAAVMSEHEIPEVIHVQVPVYTTPGCGFMKEIKLALEVHTQEQVFELIPLPDEVDRALNLTLDEIKQSLDAEVEIPVFMGTP